MCRNQISYRDRVQIDSTVHEFYRELTNGSDAPFKTMKDVFMLAACLGFRLKSRKRLSKREGIFDWSVFTEQEDVPILRSLAISETQDVDVLVDQDLLLTIAEEYANSGIIQVKQIVEQSAKPLDNLASYFLMESRLE